MSRILSVCTAIAMALAAAAQAGTVTVETIAFSENAAPGGGTPYGGIGFGNAQINEAGQVAFKAGSSASDIGLYLYTPGAGTERLVTTRTPAPGVPDVPGAELVLNGATQSRDFRLTEDGEVVFYAATNTPGVGRTSAYVASGGGTTPEALFVQGDPLSNGDVVDNAVHIQGNLPQVTGDGAVLETPTLGGSFWTSLAALKDRSGTVLLDEGQVLPSGQTVVAIDGATLRTNANGTVVAKVFTQFPCFFCQAALVRIKDGVVEELAGPMPANRIGTTDLNENDEVAWLDGNGTRSFVRKNDGTATTTIREFGHPNPGDWPQLDLNDAGQVAFAFQTNGVSTDPKAGMTFDGGPVLRPEDLFDFFVQGMNFNDNGTVGVLYRGREAQTDPIFDTRLGIMDSLGNLTEIARVGDEIEVAPGDFRTITQLIVTDPLNSNRTGEFYNDAGEFLFWAQFAPKPGIAGSSGLFLAPSRTATPIPVPAAVWMLAAGLVALGGLSRRRYRPIFVHGPAAPAALSKIPL